jgi:deoxyribonuclease V
MEDELQGERALRGRGMHGEEIAFSELYRIQEGIAAKAIIADDLQLEELRLIGGADQVFLELDAGSENGHELIISAIVVLDYPSLQFVECASSLLRVEFPYIPGLLAFREAPAILTAFHALRTKPDLLVVDGGGINHPRYSGLATHVGVLLDIATIGVTKSLLCGDGELPSQVGEAQVITYHDKAVGYYLKSKTACKPIIIAPGHRISLETSLKLIKSCLRMHKLPEPTRMAHLYANKLKREYHAQRTEP